MRTSSGSLPAGLGLSVAAVALAFGLGAQAQTKPGWRGDGSGRYPEASPPTTWSKTENVAWKVRLPKNSHTSLIVVDDLLFTMAEPAELLCLKASTGEIAWRRSHGWEYVVGAE